MEAKAIKSRIRANRSNVQLNTYMSWNLGDSFDIDVVEIEGRRIVSKIFCKSCRKHDNKIQVDCRLKGQAKTDCSTFALGSTNVKKSAVTRHLTSMAHAVGLEFEQENTKTDSSSVTANGFSGTGNTAIVKARFKNDKIFPKRQSEVYRRLIGAAYTLAADGQPLSTFKTIVSCLKACGVKLIQEDNINNKAKIFIKYLARSVRSKICKILRNSRSFGILCDGSQAHKMGKGKGLVLVRVVCPDGKSKYYVASLQDYSSGSMNADNLKKSLDDTFMNGFDVEPLYRDKVISITADGASVTAGHVEGLFDQMTEDGRPWLIGIHCILHRFELAIMDSLLQQEMFITVKELPIALYALVKQSGHFQNCLLKTAEELNVPVHRFPKVRSSRFVGNQLKGLHVLINNWVVLLVTISKSLDNSNLSDIKAKLTDIQMQLNYDLLAAACLFKSILDVIAHLSLKFEQIQPFDVLPSVEQSIIELEDLQSNADLPIDLTCGMTLLDKVLSAEPVKPGGRRKRKIDDVEPISKFNRMAEYNQAVATVDRLKHAVIPEIIRCLKEHFVSFDHPIYKSMQWIDPANWTDDDSADLVAIKTLAAHFSVHLAANKFSPDERTLTRELKSLRRIVRHYYEDKPATDMWQCILHSRRSELPNICMLVDIVMAMGVSNRFVKSCSGFLSSMLSDRRLSMMSHSTMANWFLIRANHLTWSEKELEDLITDTYSRYMSSVAKPIPGGIDSFNYVPPPMKEEALLLNNIDDLLYDSGDDDDDYDDPLQSDNDTDQSDFSDDDLGASYFDMAEANSIP